MMMTTFEFVEITNTSSTATTDFTGVNFTIGVTYAFPPGTTLEPGERLLLVSNEDAFAFRYGAIEVLGEYSENFRNSGEQVRLEAADTSAIADFTYGDGPPFPSSADGDGYSLVFTGGDPTDPANFRSSVAIGGNPLGTDSVPFTGGDVLEYIFAAPPTAEVIGSQFSIKARINLAADAATLTAQFSSDLEAWTNAPSDAISSRVNNGDGTSTLTFDSPLPQAPRMFGRFQIVLP